MRPLKWISLLFALAALYDGVFGLLFLAAPGYPFQLFGVAPPNHMGYVQFPAALLLIFGLMFAAIASDPVGNRKLIPYGILLKLAYCGVTFSYWFSTDIPNMWKPLAVTDVVMAVLFAWAYVVVCSRAKEA